MNVHLEKNGVGENDNASKETFGQEQNIEEKLWKPHMNPKPSNATRFALDSHTQIVYIDSINFNTNRVAF